MLSLSHPLAREGRTKPRARFFVCTLVCTLALACDSSSAALKEGSEGSRARDDASVGSGADVGRTADDRSFYERAIAMMTQIRPRPLVDVQTAEYTDLSLPTAGWPIVGTATFNMTSEGVDLSLELEQCRGAHAYPIALYDTASCAELGRDSKPWRDEQSGAIVPASCIGAPGGFAYHTRRSDHTQPWTLGGANTTNVIGRTIAVLDPDTREPLACGRIEATAAPEKGDTTVLRADTVAQLAGNCILRQAAYARRSDDPGGICPDPQEVARCSVAHCGVSECLTTCAEYVACIEAADEICPFDCAPSDACSRCLAPTNCLLGFCAEAVTCAPPPTPGGPCTELEECCMRQGPLASSCLMEVRKLAQLGGDTTCIGALNDFDFNTNFAFRSPCYQDENELP